MCVTRRLDDDDDSSPRGYFMPVWRRVDRALRDEMDQTGPEMLFVLQILQRPHNFISLLLGVMKNEMCLKSEANVCTY